MKPAAIPPLLLSSLTLLILVAPIGARAQASADSSRVQLMAAQAVAQAMPSACPVSLRVQQKAAGFTREIGQGDPIVPGTAQALHVTMTDPESRKIVAASVTVHGLDDKGRRIDVFSTEGTRGETHSDVARTINIRLAHFTAAEVEANLRVPGLSVVNAVEVNSVTFADGATWKIAAPTCRTPIDGMMLVSDR
jgi:hypothetical protein